MSQKIDILTLERRIKERVKIQDIRRRVEKVVFDSMRKAFAEELPGSLKDVAKASGKLRAAIQADLTRQLVDQKGSLAITLQLNKNRITRLVNYAQYHWGVGPTGKPTYREPTTPHTAPIKPTKFLAPIREKAIIYIREGLKKERIGK